MVTLLIRINKFFETDYTIKIKVKKEQRLDRATVIFKLRSKKKKYIYIYIKHVLLYNCEKDPEILTKTLKYAVNTSKTFVST